MWLVITGGVVAGVIGLGALYDHVARRRGRSESFGSSGRNASFRSQNEHNPLI